MQLHNTDRCILLLHIKKILIVFDRKKDVGGELGFFEEIDTVSLNKSSRGLHYVSLCIRERLGYIAEELKSYDIIGLQEVWSFFH